MACNQIQTEKLIILKNFINKNKDLAVQGSEQWLTERQYIVGGSEVASVIGKNPFSSLQGLIAQKVKLMCFTGNTACSWGNLFENVSELLFKTMFIDTNTENNKIYATGSIQHSTIANHRYSPDGLCCIKYIENNTECYKTTLLEFKSPYSSVPTAKVPVHYLPQIKSGLCTIDIAETGLFVNNMFRKCALSQLNYTLDYDNKYHRDTDKKLENIESTLATGLILFSINISKLHLFYNKYNKLQAHVSGSESDPEIINTHSEFADNVESNDKFDDSESDSENEKYFDDGSNILYKICKNILNYQENIALIDKQNNLYKNMIDLGNETKELFDQFLVLYKPEDNSTFINIKCVKPQINKEIIHGLTNLVLPPQLNYVKSNDIYKKYNSTKCINKFINLCIDTQQIPIAVLPYKLLRSSVIIVEKEDNYLNNIKDQIDNCIDIVKNISENSKSMDDTANLFEKHFENNAITKKYFECKPHTYDFVKDFI